MKSTKGESYWRQELRAFGFMTMCLVVLLGWLFRESLRPDFTTFNNDTPLGVMSQTWVWQLSNMWGVWMDLNWLGISSVSAVPNVTHLFYAALGSTVYLSKLLAPFSLLVAGLSAWFCFRRWKFAHPVCFLAGLATVLHGNYLPNACWGVCTQVIGFGMEFIALGLLADTQPRTRWASVMLAGFAVGLGVTEGWDIGALFSVTVAAFIVWQALARDGEKLKNLLGSAVQLVLVAGCAGMISAGMIHSLVGTQITGISNMAQDEASKARRWEEATQWSTYKRETIGLFVPAFFGFRMDTPNGGEYWGFGGRTESWDRYLAGGPLETGDIISLQVPGSATLGQPQQFMIGNDGLLADSKKLLGPGAATLKLAGLTHEQAETALKNALTATGATAPNFRVELPRGMLKFGGGGGYAGAMVLVLAAWAVVQSFRRQHSIFTPFERRIVWFWFAVAVFAQLLSYGRFLPSYLPSYRWFFALPGASTMRIPGKFGHLVAWATLILFAYGAQALWVRYVVSAPATTRGLLDQWSVWWAKVGGFERRWIIGSCLFFSLAVGAWTYYGANRGSMENYIAKINFYEALTQGRQPNPEAAATAARAQMSFSLWQSAKALGFFGAALLVVAIGMTGYFGGARWKIGAGLLAALILGQLGPASTPWVITYNWKEKYIDAGNNPVIKFLAQKPYENRVAILSGSLPVNLDILEPVYGGDWKQHLFQYYGIQTIDIVQMPRVPVELQQWEGALHFNGAPENLHLPWRRWQLMNTRYLLGGAGMVEELNKQLKPNAPFRELMRFDFYQERSGGPILTRTNAQAQFALIEYTGALPRAKLYTNWQVNTNDEVTLQTLRRAEFNPEQTVCVATPINAPSSPGTNSGTVEFVSYAPKRIVLKATATAAAVLLLNDKYDANWNVYVDGQPALLLRCNYVMRGVQVPAGMHTVEFRYEPPTRMLYVSLAASVALLVLVGYVGWVRWREILKPA